MAQLAKYTCRRRNAISDILPTAPCCGPWGRDTASGAQSFHLQSGRDRRLLRPSPTTPHPGWEQPGDMGDITPKNPLRGSLPCTSFMWTGLGFVTSGKGGFDVKPRLERQFFTNIISGRGRPCTTPAPAPCHRLARLRCEVTGSHGFQAHRTCARKDTSEAILPCPRPSPLFRGLQQRRKR